jgi:hypothetical protein
MVKELDLVGMSIEDAAKKLYELVCELARDMGQEPEIECHLNSPERSVELGYGRCWQVSWEAGPYQWGIALSMSDGFPLSDYGSGMDSSIPVKHLDNDKWFLEPYYSFDVCFAEA